MSLIIFTIIFYYTGPILKMLSMVWKWTNRMDTSYQMAQNSSSAVDVLVDVSTASFSGNKLSKEII